MISVPPAKQLRRAAAIKEKIDSLKTELSHLIGTEASNRRTASVTGPRNRKLKMSAAAKAKNYHGATEKGSEMTIDIFYDLKKSL